MVGADYARGPLTVGLSVGRTLGLGGYSGPSSGQMITSMAGSTRAWATRSTTRSRCGGERLASSSTGRVSPAARSTRGVCTWSLAAARRRRCAPRGGESARDVASTTRFLALCQRYGSEQLAVRIIAPRGGFGMPDSRPFPRSVPVGVEGPGKDYKPERFGFAPPETTVEARRDVERSILAACGVPPVLANHAAPGTSMREAWRQLTVGTVEPLATLIADQLSDALSVGVTLTMPRSADVATLARAVQSLTGPA